MSNVLRFGTELDDNVSGKLKGIAAAFDRVGGKGGGASLFGNVGAAAFVKGLNLVGLAADNVVGALGDMIHSAIEDEQSQARLATALRANIPAWDGQTAAIESVIDARMRLGFTDEEQRNSLALLVAAHNDVTTALELQRTAMDLARLKGISLDDATQALIKTEDGHYRVLQSLGIVLNDNATAQDAINAVQAVAAGQAESYANTSGGKLLAVQVKIGELMEKLGKTILPAVQTALEAVVFVVDTLTTAWDALSKKLSEVLGLLDRVTSLGRSGAAKELFGSGLAQHGLPTPESVMGHASGGWVGMSGPELIQVGEKGPEYVVPNDRLRGGSSAGVTIQGVSESDIMEMVDRGLYFRLQRAAPTSVKS